MFKVKNEALERTCEGEGLRNLCSISFTVNLPLQLMEDIYNWKIKK